MIDKSLRQIQERQGGGIVPDQEVTDEQRRIWLQERQRMETEQRRAEREEFDFNASRAEREAQLERIREEQRQEQWDGERRAERNYRRNRNAAYERSRVSNDWDYPSKTQRDYWNRWRMQDQTRRGFEAEERHILAMDDPEFRAEQDSIAAAVQSQRDSIFAFERERPETDEEYTERTGRHISERRVADFLLGEDRLNQARREDIVRDSTRGESRGRSRQIHADYESGLRPGFHERLQEKHDEDPDFWPPPEEVPIRTWSGIFGGTGVGLGQHRIDPYPLGDVNYRPWSEPMRKRLQGLLDATKDSLVDVYDPQLEDEEDFRGKLQRDRLFKHTGDLFGRAGDVIKGLVLPPEGPSPLSRARDSEWGQGLAGSLGSAKDWALGLPGRGVRALGRGAAGVGRGFSEVGDAVAESATHEPGWGRMPPPYEGDRNVEVPKWLQEFQTGTTSSIPHANRAARALGYSQNRANPNVARRR